MIDAPAPSRRPNRTGARSAARLAAVQAIYQIEMTDTKPTAVVAEFLRYRIGQETAEDGQEGWLVEADPKIFTELVEGAYARLPELDRLIGPALTPDWPLERLDMVLRAILRIATFELVARIEVPVRVVITEAVDLAHAFFAGKEPALVNGVLDRLGRQLRATELAGDPPA